MSAETMSLSAETWTDYKDVRRWIKHLQCRQIQSEERLGSAYTQAGMQVHLEVDAHTLGALAQCLLLVMLSCMLGYMQQGRIAEAWQVVLPHRFSLLLAFPQMQQANMRRVSGSVIGSVVADAAVCRTCVVMRALRGCAGQRTSPNAWVDVHPAGQTSAAWSVPRSFVTLLADSW